MDDLVGDKPKTQVAALHFRKHAVKAGTVMGVSLRDITVDVMSETAKKAVVGP